MASDKNVILPFHLLSCSLPRFPLKGLLLECQMQEQEASLGEKASQVEAASCSLEVGGREVSGANRKYKAFNYRYQLLLSKHVQKNILGSYIVV